MYMEKFMKNKGLGFTLVELMIAVAIVGILAAISIPSYTTYISKGRRADAQGSLMSLAQAMERYQTENSTYVGATLGSAATDIFPNQAPLDDTSKFYTLTIESQTASAFVLRATPINGQVGDGIMELTSRGAKGWDSDNSGGIDADENCWSKSC